MTTALVIHGHFYQPPRENPWTELVEREPGAEPFHDWNERIHAECYRPNAYARIGDAHGGVERIVNNYARLSFNFGPTLLNWLERRHPDTYARVVEADRDSARRRNGHGNAIAQGYNHSILPLCNERDRRTQVRWGLADFRRRFDRDAEALWLPETACDDATLETLIEEGLRFVVLSPFQAEAVRTPGAAVWQQVPDGRIDTTVPYKYLHRDGSGRSVAVFFYDGRIARAVAFEGLLASVVNVATDGESYGHHFRWGDRSIAYALEVEAERHGLRVTNYGEFLDGHEPEHEVRLKRGPGGEGTAWSCAHGLGRWTRDCGCNASAPGGWNQRWRAPLRAAFDLLRDDLAPKFEDACGELLREPWGARDEYVELLGPRPAPREEFLARHARRALVYDERVRALTLLEAQRASMTMYTSCGWFFNDISGIETVQTLRYAGRVVETMESLGLAPPVERFLETLSEAKSNLLERPTGADIYLRAVEHSRVTPQRVAAHFAICNLIERDERDAECESAGYDYRKLDFRKQRHGRVTLETVRLALEEWATGRRHEFALAAMHFGEIDYYCALRPFEGEREFEEAAAVLWSQLRAASLPVLLRVARSEFGPEEFGLEALLSEGRGHLSRSVFGKLTARFMDEYEHLYEENRRVVERLQEIGFQLPRELRLAAELTVGLRLERVLRDQRRGAGDYRAAVEIARDAARFGYRIDRTSVARVFEETLTETARLVVVRPTPETVASARALIELGRELGLEANLERAQEILYEAAQTGAPLSAEAREFALALGLAPVALAKPEPEHAQAGESKVEPFAAVEEV
jgi:alpha-amylase/alpha-mannosidase (GH57 family)